MPKQRAKVRLAENEKMKVNMYIEPNLLLIKGNKLKIENKVYEKCFQCTIKL